MYFNFLLIKNTEFSPLSGYASNILKGEKQKSEFYIQLLCSYSTQVALSDNVQDQSENWLVVHMTAEGILLYLHSSLF